MDKKLPNGQYMSDKYVKTPKELKTSSSEIFSLDIDLFTVLQIQMEELKTKIKCTLLGLKHKHYLLIDLPMIVDSSFFETCKESEGKLVICRYVYEGTVYGFKTTLLGLINAPVDLMILDYPKKAEECNLRRQQRTGIVLPVKIKFDKTLFQGSIVDISEIGCQLIILNTSINSKDMSIIEKTEADCIRMLLTLPGEENIIVPTVRRNVRYEDDKVCVGLEFNKNADTTIFETVKKFVIEMRKYSLVA